MKIVNPKIAPNPAPVPTPSKYGSANGFLNIAWKPVPDADRIIPVKITNKDYFDKNPTLSTKEI